MPIGILYLSCFCGYERYNTSLNGRCDVASSDGVW